MRNPYNGRNRNISEGMKQEQQKEHLQLKADLTGNFLIDKACEPHKQLGIFYAPSGGSVHKVARQIKQRLAAYAPDIFVISDIQPSILLDYRNLILVSSTLGRSTWEMEQRDPWTSFLPQLQRLHLLGRKVALVGLGDHVSYANNFVDGMRVLADIVENIGGELIGETETVDYVFNDSKALRHGKCVGLPLDEDYESERTEARIERWLNHILPILR